MSKAMKKPKPPRPKVVKVLPKCIQCDINTSVLWRIVEEQEICNDCYETNQERARMEANPESGPLQLVEQIRRRSTRSTRYRSKGSAVFVKPLPKGRSRRHIFKKNPTKAPRVNVVTHSVEYLFHKNQYFQIGDIVSLRNEKDNVYYAQIHGLLKDIFCEKSAFITWLIPTTSSPPPNKTFDPSTYLIGPVDETARKIDCLQFVMHAPSDYYHDKGTPYPPDKFEGMTSKKYNNFIWTNLRYD